MIPSTSDASSTPDSIDALAAEVADTIAREGSFDITKDTGLFVCR